MASASCVQTLLTCAKAQERRAMLPDRFSVGYFRLGTRLICYITVRCILCVLYFVCALFRVKSTCLTVIGAYKFTIRHLFPSCGDKSVCTYNNTHISILNWHLAGLSCVPSRKFLRINTFLEIVLSKLLTI